MNAPAGPPRTCHNLFSTLTRDDLRHGYSPRPPVARAGTEREAEARGGLKPVRAVFCPAQAPGAAGRCTAHGRMSSAQRGAQLGILSCSPRPAFPALLLAPPRWTGASTPTMSPPSRTSSTSGSPTRQRSQRWANFRARCGVEVRAHAVLSLIAWGRRPLTPPCTVAALALLAWDIVTTTDEEVRCSYSLGICSSARRCVMLTAAVPCGPPGQADLVVSTRLFTPCSAHPRGSHVCVHLLLSLVS